MYTHIIHTCAYVHISYIYVHMCTHMFSRALGDRSTEHTTGAMIVSKTAWPLLSQNHQGSSKDEQISSHLPPNVMDVRTREGNRGHSGGASPVWQGWGGLSGPDSGEGTGTRSPRVCAMTEDILEGFFVPASLRFALALGYEAWTTP